MRRRKRLNGTSLQNIIVKLIQLHRPDSLKELVADCRYYPNYRYSYSVVRREIGKLINSGSVELEPRGINKRPLLKKGGLDRLRRPTAGRSLRSGNTVQLSLLPG